MQDVPLKFSRY